MKMVFTAGNGNSVKITEDRIAIEFNPSVHEAYSKLIRGIFNTTTDLGLDCRKQLTDFVGTLPQNESLWLGNGKWAGVPFSKEYEVTT